MFTVQGVGEHFMSRVPFPNRPVSLLNSIWRINSKTIFILL